MKITRMVVASACVLSMSALLGAGGATPAKINGSWAVTKFVVDGGEAPAKALKGMSVSIKNGKLQLTSGGKTAAAFSFTVDASKSPNQIKMKALTGKYAGKTSEGILRIDGSGITVCVPNKPGVKAPTKFTSPPGGELVLISLKKAS